MGNISVQANIIFVCTFTEEKNMNGFDDFDTQQQSEEVYRYAGHDTRRYVKIRHDTLPPIAVVCRNHRSRSSFSPQ